MMRFPWLSAQRRDAFDPRMAQPAGIYRQPGAAQRPAARPAAAPRVDVQRAQPAAPAQPRVTPAMPAQQAQAQRNYASDLATAQRGPMLATAGARPAPQQLGVAADRAAAAQQLGAAQSAGGPANVQRQAAPMAPENQALISNALAQQQQANRNDYARRAAPEDDENAPLGRFM